MRPELHLNISFNLFLGVIPNVKAPLRLSLQIVRLHSSCHSGCKCNTLICTAAAAVAAVVTATAAAVTAAAAVTVAVAAATASVTASSTTYAVTGGSALLSIQVIHHLQVASREILELLQPSPYHFRCSSSSSSQALGHHNVKRLRGLH